MCDLKNNFFSSSACVENQETVTQRNTSVTRTILIGFPPKKQMKCRSAMAERLIKSMSGDAMSPEVSKLTKPRLSSVVEVSG